MTELMTELNHAHSVYKLLPPQPPIIEEPLRQIKFDYIKNNSNREMLETAWNAVQLTKTENYFKENIQSFTFTLDPRSKLILNKIEELGYCGHSGNSFGWTLRQIQRIILHGEEAYKQSWLKSS